MNNVWLNWLRGLFWGPAHDERFDRIDRESASIKEHVAVLEERMSVLEETAGNALRRLAGDADQ